MQTILKIGITFLATTIIFLAGIGMGYFLRGYIAQDAPNSAQADNFALYWEAWNRVEGNFYGDIPPAPQSTYGAIRGALATLNDPYTVFIEPEPAQTEKEHLDGQFGGIGAYINPREGKIFLDPMPGRPAEAAGIKKDDQLVAVNGITITAEMTTDEVVKLVKGEVGTKVVLTIERGGQRQEITVERAVIETPSVQWRLLDEDKTIGYIQMSVFTARSNAELGQALDELAAQGAKKYIFDLRRNGGGLLEAAVDVASQFLQDGSVLRENRKNEGEHVYEVRAGGKLLNEPLVLLIDGGTASASEIVGGALQDHKRATLIGEKSFGKGSVQLIYELSGGSRLHVTVAKWFTPENHKIDKEGLHPDIEVLFTQEDHDKNRDPQLARAISFLQTGK